MTLGESRGSRRAFLKRMGAGAAAALVGGRAPVAVKAASTPSPAPTKAVSAKEITVWMAMTGAWKTFFERTVEDFNKQQTRVKVRAEFPFAGADLTVQMQKVRLALQAQDAADVIHSDAVGRQVEEYQSTGQILKLNDAYREFGWDKRFAKSSFEMVRVGPDFYAVPETLQITGYYYNKDAFRKAGAKAPATWPEFLEQGAKLKGNKMPLKVVGVRGGWPAAFYGSAYMYAAAGSRYREALEGKATWLDPKMEEGLKALKSLVDLGYTNPDPLALNAQQEQEEFFQGKSVSIFRPDGFFGQIKGTKPAFEVGFYPLPLINPGSDIKIFGGVGGSWVVFAGTKDREGALKFLDYAFSEAVAKAHATAGLGTLPTLIDLPADVDPLIMEMNRIQREHAGVSIGHWPVCYLAPGTFAKLHSFIQGLLGGKLSARGVLEEMEKAMKAAK